MRDGGCRKVRFLCCKGRFCPSKVISCVFESEKFNINGKESKVAFCTETRTFAADFYTKGAI